MRPHQLWRHRIGSRPEEDELVFADVGVGQEPGGLTDFGQALKGGQRDGHPFTPSLGLCQTAENLPFPGSILAISQGKRIVTLRCGGVINLECDAIRTDEERELGKLGLGLHG